jgi:cysteine synthase
MGGGGWRPEGWKKNGKFLNLGQYDNPAIKTGYRDWAVQKILQEVGEFQVLVCPVGTGGTVIGLSEGFRSRFPVTVVGALCADGHEIPGMRDEKGMEDVHQAWEAALDYRIKVNRSPAFLCAPWIDWLTGEPTGPSSGAAYVAACLFIQGLIDEDKLDHVRDEKTGEVKVLFVLHDEVTPYVADRFMTEFALENFHLSTAHSPRQLVFG